MRGYPGNNREDPSTDFFVRFGACLTASPFRIERRRAAAVSEQSGSTFYEWVYLTPPDGDRSRITLQVFFGAAIQGLERVFAIFKMAIEMSVEKTVPVLVADEHSIWREAVRALLEGTEFVVVGEAASADAALESVRRLLPQLVLLDIRMAGGSDLAMLAALKQGCTLVRVVLLSSYDNPALQERVRVAGAAGYMVKGCGRDEFIGVLRDAQNALPA